MTGMLGKAGGNVEMKVTRISILGMMLLVVLWALILVLFIRLHEEAFVYVAGPLLGPMLAAASLVGAIGLL